MRALREHHGIPEIGRPTYKMSCSSQAAIIPILRQVRLLIVQMLKMVDVMVEAQMILLMLMVDFPLVVMLMESLSQIRERNLDYRM